MKTQPTFTISRTTQRGVQEFLTANGFRSISSHISDERLRFTLEDAHAKVKQLKKDCRIPSIARSIMVNY